MSERFLNTRQDRAALDSHLTDAPEPDELFTYGEAWVSRDDLPEDAGTIQEVRDGYSVAFDGSHVITVDDQDEAELWLARAMEAARFYPDCYFINERGNVTQIIPNA